MKFCSHCGNPVELRIPTGDNRERFVCAHCDAVHYQNPKIVAGCLAEWEGRILMCRRAIQPRAGLWTLPAGFMENDETTSEAAARETLEEANARVELTDLYTVFSLPHVSQVYMVFRGRLLDLDYSPGDESLEVELFEEADIPWPHIAFETIRQTLRFYFEDRRSGRFGLHMGDIIRRGGEAEFFSRRPATSAK
jgi:ADP-ribose pyrophosphatase YjhB (NUDIX family)